MTYVVYLGSEAERAGQLSPVVAPKITIPSMVRCQRAAEVKANLKCKMQNGSTYSYHAT